MAMMAVGSPADASTTYVVNNASSACSDTGQGTASQPFCTIAAAAGVAQAGDTVQVSGGAYTGTAVNPAHSGTAGSPITFAAQPGVTISGGADAFALSSRNYIVVSGFTISATTSAGIVVSNGAEDTISDNIVSGTKSYGISVSGGSDDTVSGNTESFAGTPQTSPAAGIYLHNLDGGLVLSNITHDNSAHGIYLTGSTTGVTVEGNTSYRNAYQYVRNANGIDDIAPGNSLIGNITYANEDTGINIYPGANDTLIAGNVSYGNGDHGIDDLNVTGGRIVGNTVYGNCTDGINVEGTSGDYAIDDNVSMNNATGAVINPTPILETNGQPDYTNLCNRRVGNIGVYDSAPATSTADYNLVWQSGPGAEYSWAGTTYSTQAALYAATGQEQHGIFANPDFVNAAADDFQLSSGSPAIDAANTSVSGYQHTDILGVSPHDDLGAYEFVGTAQTGPTAALSVTPVTGTAPLAVTASASGSTAGTAPISTYTFSFGDGTTVGPQSSATATHTYTTAGTYTVTVTVTDTSNLTSQATQTVTVGQQAAGPVAALSVTPVTGNAPLAVTASASGSTAGTAPISTYTFSFGDGTTVGPQSSATATHTYTTAGTYTVTVTVTDTSNLTSQATQTVTVSQATTTTAKYVNQIATNYSTSAGKTSGYVTVWRTGGVAAGDLIIATVQLTGTTAGPVTGTDTLGDTLNVVSDISDGAGDRLVTVAGIAKAGLPVNDRVIINFPAAASYRMTADEVSGVTAADQEAAASGTGSAFSSGTTAATARGGEFVYAVVATFGGTTLSWSSGWTAATTYTLGSDALGRAYQIPATTGTFAATGTASGTWLAEVITFE
jgi:parallel beta-helix repeat protein